MDGQALVVMEPEHPLKSFGVARVGHALRYVSLIRFEVPQAQALENVLVVQDWSVDDIAHWVEGSEFSCYRPKLIYEDIYGRAMILMKEGEALGLGIRGFRLQRKDLQARGVTLTECNMTCRPRGTPGI